MANIVLGVFSEHSHAEDAIAELEDKGYNPKDMSILMKDTGEAHRISETTGAGEVISGTVGGAVTGAALGGIAGLVASFLVPGLGALFIGGPIAAALGLTGAAATTASGAATGALAGGLLGALTSTFGLTDQEARLYEDRIRAGGILIAVPARMGEETEVEAILSNHGADNLKTVSTLERTVREESAERFGPAYYSEMRRGRKTKKSR